jgi:glycosyltransferase involved in cell wall biosynthesis
MFGVQKRVKILLVSHRFPPRGNAGTETYTAELGLGLARRGHEVHVFTSAKDISRRHLAVHERDHFGVRVHELFNNLYYRDFRETWESPAIDAIFGDVCARLAPDVVHFQHLLYLSLGCVELAHAAAPVFFTLHDYWLQCPRFGQRVHADGGICDVIDFARCGTCLASFKYAQSDAERRVGKIVAGVRAGTGIDLSSLARSGRSALSAGDASSGVDAAEAARMSRAAEERTRELERRVLASVDLFLAPSRFLRERFMREWRLPADKIELVRFGIDRAAFADQPRVRGDKIQVAFIGSLIPIKGPQLLLKAWAALDVESRRRAELTIYGPSEHEPQFQRELVELARAAGARLGGKLERTAVGDALARIDLLVVPSLWYENAPLVIHEALVARTPLLVSDMGGMAELVEPGESGYRFRMGDVADLSRALGELIADRSRLDRLYARPVSLPRVEDHLDAIEARYRDHVERRRRS